MNSAAEPEWSPEVIEAASGQLVYEDVRVILMAGAQPAAASSLTSSGSPSPSTILMWVLASDSALN